MDRQRDRQTEIKVDILYLDVSSFFVIAFGCSPRHGAHTLGITTLRRMAFIVMRVGVNKLRRISLRLLTLGIVAFITYEKCIFLSITIKPMLIVVDCHYVE